MESRPHIVLLGDSIFDNGVYVPGKPSVSHQLESKIASRSWKCTLLAVDGNVILDVERQLKSLPTDATHLFVSVGTGACASILVLTMAGGNNGLRYMSHLTTEAKTLADALLVMAKLRDKFKADYNAMIEKVLALKLPTAVCTVYNPRFPSAREQTVCETGLCFLNDVIFATAAQHNLPIIDLRLVCCDAADYANAIEPSSIGGDKITDNIITIVAEHDFTKPSSIHTHGYKPAPAVKPK